MAKNNTLQRFVIIGGTATILDFAILGILTLLGTPPVMANIIATGIAFVFSFYANRNYTFKANQKNLLRQAILFSVVTLTGIWGLQSIVLYYGIPLTSMVIENSLLSLYVTKAIATGVSMVWNYLLYKNIVFKTTGDTNSETHSH